MFQGVDDGAKYFFDFQAYALEPWMPLFRAGYYAGSLPAAGGIVLVLAGFWFWRGQPRRAIALVTTLLAGATLVVLLRQVIGRPQPDKAHLFLTSDGMFPSFPSLTVFLAALAAIFAVMTVAHCTSRRLFCYAALLGGAAFVIWVMVSQMFLRVHFLSDMLASLAAAAGFALLGWFLGDAFTDARLDTQTVNR